ncbi:beta-lactamase family protein [Chloroflexi bacterium TSY]|nr:beta-lactamase family protein [Chloroflexi bacterium TSY]
MQLIAQRPEQVGISPHRIERITQAAESWVVQGVAQGLVALVAHRGSIVLHSAFGHLVPGQDSPSLTADAVFPLVSLTKPITATAIMLLVEDGLLGLNRPVSEYVPEFVGTDKDAVMVHHLLTHTSGLSDEELELHVVQKGLNPEEIPPADTTQHPRSQHYLYPGYDQPLGRPIGSEMRYCNYGYELLGEIVRRVSGQSIADFAQSRIFEPLSMNDTSYIVPDAMRKRIVQRPDDAPLAVMDDRGHLQSHFQGINSQSILEAPWANGGVFSTAYDMAIFGQMFLNGGNYGDVRILSPAIVSEMTRNQIPGIGARNGDEFFPEAGWGLGWSVHGNKKALYDGTLYSSKTYSHGGAGGVQLWIDPVYEIVGVYFAIATEFTELGVPREQPDLFMNMVTASVTEI